MGYLSNVKKLYVITFFHSLIPAYVIERLFWQQRGMNVQMVVYCEIIYATTVIIMEIPSGIMADCFGRKRMLLIAGLLSSIEFIILLFANGFKMFCFAVFLSGIGTAFSSGSENALLYDSLLAENRQSSFEKLAGRFYAIDFIATIIAALSGSLLGVYFNFELNYTISFFSMLIAFIMSFTLKEPPIVTKEKSEFYGIIMYAKQSFLIFKKQPLVLLYCTTGAFLGSCLIYLDEFWQLVLKDVGVPVVLFGVFGSLIYVLRIPGNLFAYKLKEKFPFHYILRVMIIVNIIGYIIMSFTMNVLCLLPMIFVSLTAGISEPLISGYLHHHTESHIRATVESISSLFLRLLSVLVGLIFGYISTKISLFGGFAFLSVVCLCYFIIFEIAIHSKKE